VKTKIKKFLAIVWYRYLQKFWNLIPSSIEALWYIRKRRLGAKRLKMLKVLGDKPTIVERIMRSYGFQWRRDPLWGKLDYHSKPWVTCARGAGDCDDFACLWAEILKSKEVEFKLLSTYSKKRGHVMCVARMENGISFLLSNYRVLSVARTKIEEEFFEKIFYGDDTLFSFYH